MCDLHIWAPFCLCTFFTYEKQDCENANLEEASLWIHDRRRRRKRRLTVGWLEKEDRNPRETNRIAELNHIKCLKFVRTQCTLIAKFMFRVQRTSIKCHGRWCVSRKNALRCKRWRSRHWDRSLFLSFSTFYSSSSAFLQTRKIIEWCSEFFVIYFIKAFGVGCKKRHDL